MRIALIIIVLATIFAPPAIADEVRILSSRGGEVSRFLDLFEGVRKTGNRVVIDGPCLSACTLVLSVVPNSRICVTRRAILGFHAARLIDRHGRLYAQPEATEPHVRIISNCRSWLDPSAWRANFAPVAATRT
jgi:hypothetical protein